MAKKKKYQISYNTGSGRKPEQFDKLDRLFQPGKCVAFLDAEFNAGMNYASGERINEIISVGLVICDEDYKELERFYSLVSPLSKIPIFPLIREMTGITTDMLKGQPDFINVSNQISDLLKKHDVQRIYTWGAADKYSLQSEKESYCLRDKSNKYLQWDYIDMCTDISGIISGQMLGVRGGLAINMENLMFLCEIDRVHEHNALSDAVDLYQCVAALRVQYPLEQCDKAFLRKREMVNRYYQEKSLYNSFRRFKSTSKGSDLYEKWGTEGLEKDMRIKALEDDLKFLKGEIPYESEFESIQEYFINKS